jgi:TonB family protein
MPIFDEMQKKYGARGFTVLAVSLDREGWDVVRPYIAEREWSYPVFVADESVEKEFGKITSLPTTYFVRRDGTIETKHVGGLSESHIVRHVESLLDGKPGNRADTAGRSAPVKRGTSGRDTGLQEQADEIRIRDIDEFSPPKMVGFVAPGLTDQERDAGVTGPVELGLHVQEDGSVRDIEVIRGVGLGLDERVIEAVKQARFEPAKNAGKPISTRMKIKVDFKVTKITKPDNPNE